MSSTSTSVNKTRAPKTAEKEKRETADFFPVLFLPLIVLVIALVAGVVFSPAFSSIWGEGVPTTAHEAPKVIPIKRVVWDPKRSILDYLKENPDEPVIFENTQVELWRARRVWKPTYVRRVFGSEAFALDGAYVHNSSVFGPYFDPSKPLNMEGVREKIVRVNEHRVWSPSSAHFFSALESPTPNEWNYYATKLRLLPSTLLMDVDPYDNILELDPQSTEENMNFWVGQEGVSAACHYDGYDNINVQLFGRKQWNLYAPSNHTYMYLFPFLHFHHAQTQVDIEHPDLGAFPLFPKAVRYEGITGPGEAIYMPAMWFHGVQTLNTSINVNSWVKTPTSHMLESISNELPTDISVQAAQYYLRQLLHFLDRSPSFVWDSVVTPRYQRLFDTGQIDANAMKDDIMKQCLRKRGHDSNDASATGSDSTLPASGSKKAKVERFEYISAEEGKKLRTMAERHAKRFHTVPSDTIDIWLGNHIEFVLAYATQDPIITASILFHCF